MKPNKLIWLIPVLIPLLIPEPTLGGTASLKSKWRQDVVTVCFIGGDEGMNELIAIVARKWTSGGGIDLDFGPAYDLHKCDKSRKFDIRVGFADFGYWSYLGTDSKRVPNDRPTLNLQGFDHIEQGEKISEATLRGAILHNFGHALGLLHQEQSPDSKCLDELDREKIQKMFSTSSDAFYRDLKPIKYNSDYLITPFTADSVMRHSFSAEYYVRGADSPCYGPPQTKLSEDDKNLFRLLYPGPGSSIVTDPKPKGSVTIRFEGPLGAQHYGFALSELNKRQKLNFVQLADFEGSTIGEILEQHGLVPGSISESLEQFLCETNRHICESSGGRVLWTNIGANASQFSSYYEPGPCGGRDLPRFIVCIPDIHMDKYRTKKVFTVDGSGHDLAYWVRKTKACKTLDDRCRALLLRFNKSDDIFEKDYEGRVQLPVEAFSVTLEAPKSSDRGQIIDIVENFIRSRAQQLRVPEAEVAIRVTVATGQSRSQAINGPLYLEPMAGYTDPLRRMGYPYGDGRDEEAAAATYGYLMTLPSIGIGVWDGYVDVNHCDFKRGQTSVVYEQEPSRRPDEQPPASAGEDCGGKKDANPNDTYDHATHIVGILAAQVNGKGVAGINPRAKIWDLVVSGRALEGDPITEERLRDGTVDPDVINISQSFSIDGPGVINLYALLFGDNTASEQESQGFHEDILFVAAAGLSEDMAGNEVARHIDEAGFQCQVYPACWSNEQSNTPRGLISVVALDGAGTAVLKYPESEKLASNYGQAFDVAAIGEAESTFYGNWFGVMRGSSVAAPYVTGLASLVFAKVKKDRLSTNVFDVKQRILFTADMEGDLKNLARFGRINFGRALDYAFDRIDLRSSAACEPRCQLAGRLNAVKSADIEIISGLRDGGRIQNFKISAGRVKRVIRQPDVAEAMYTLIYDDFGWLRKIEDARISGNREIWLKVDGDEKRVWISDVDEFVACSFYPDCGSR